MARIQLEVPDATVPRIAAAFGYNETDGAVGPFLKARLIDLIRERVIQHESQRAGEAASEAARKKAKGEIEVG